MNRGLIVAAMLAAANSACNRTITVGSAPQPPAGAVATQTKVAFVFSMPSGEEGYDLLLTELIQDFNKGVGYNALIIPTPLYTPTSEVDWMSSDAGLASGICQGTRRPGTPPTMQLALSTNYAKAHLTNAGKLSSTPYWPGFAYCIGQAMGLPYSTTANDVMDPDFTQTKDWAGFWGKVNGLTETVEAQGT